MLRHGLARKQEATRRAQPRESHGSKGSKKMHLCYRGALCLSWGLRLAYSCRGQMGRRRTHVRRHSTPRDQSTIACAQDGAGHTFSTNYARVPGHIVVGRAPGPSHGTPSRRAHVCIHAGRPTQQETWGWGASNEGGKPPNKGRGPRTAQHVVRRACQCRQQCTHYAYGGVGGQIG